MVEERGDVGFDYTSRLEKEALQLSPSDYKSRVFPRRTISIFRDPDKHGGEVSPYVIRIDPSPDSRTISVYGVRSEEGRNLASKIMEALNSLDSDLGNGKPLYAPFRLAEEVEIADRGDPVYAE